MPVHYDTFAQNASRVVQNLHADDSACRPTEQAMRNAGRNRLSVNDSVMHMSAAERHHMHS